MNPDPDLERLEERVREAFPAVFREPKALTKAQAKRALATAFPSDEEAPIGWSNVIMSQDLRSPKPQEKHLFTLQAVLAILRAYGVDPEQS